MFIEIKMIFLYNIFTCEYPQDKYIYRGHASSGAKLYVVNFSAEKLQIREVMKTVELVISHISSFVTYPIRY